MNPTSSARLIRSFKEAFFFSVPLFLILSVLLCLPFSAYPAEIKTPKDLSTELIRKIEEAVKDFQKPLKKEEYQEIISRTKEEALKGLSQGETRAKQGCQPDSATLYYFFSFSMPEETILRAMREAVRINGECEERVTLVLRGFVKNDLKATASQFYKYLRKIGDDIPIEVDPELFERFDVKEVPAIVQARDDDIALIRGDIVGLNYALSRFIEGFKDYGVYGKTYPIMEENILKVLASKQNEIEKRLRERLPEIKKRMLVLTKYDGGFEQVKKERVYYVNPKLILSDNILDHQGNVLFPKGTVFDPSKYVKLGRYVIIDGNSRPQAEFAVKGDFRRIILISGDLEKLTKTYKKPFYFANDAIIERFKIKRVPVVIEGDGEYVRVTEKAL